MGLFDSIGNFFRRLFGMGEGAISNASDRMLTASEASIRAQFRKVRDKLKKNHETIRNAVANLMAIVEGKKQEVAELEKRLKDLETKKIGAVRKFKETNDPKYQDAFKETHALLQKNQEKLEIDKIFITDNEQNLERYKRQLLSLQNKIEELKVQEDQAIADIVSSRQVTKLNDVLAGFSTDFDMQGIETIEEARKKALAKAKLSSELSITNKEELDDELMKAGSDVDDEFARLLSEEENRTSGQGQAEIERSL